MTCIDAPACAGAAHHGAPPACAAAAVGIVYALDAHRRNSVRDSFSATWSPKTNDGLIAPNASSRSLGLARSVRPYDRELMRSIGACTGGSRRKRSDAPWTICCARLAMRHSATGVAELDIAAVAWISQLRQVAINAAHPALADLDDRSYEAMLARVASHEWAHDLAVVRATRDDSADGERLLQLVPAGVRAFVSRGGYRRSEYTMNSSPRSRPA